MHIDCSDEAWVMRITFMLFFARAVKSLAAIPTTPAMPLPASETRHTEPAEVTALIALPLDDVTEEMSVPCSDGAKVFLMETGISLFITGSIEGG